MNNAAEKIKPDLDAKLLQLDSKQITTDEYREIAKLYKALAENTLNEILDLHSRRIHVEVNSIHLATQDSVLNSSTAFGFLIEEFIAKQLPAYFERSIGPTASSAYDFKYAGNGPVELLVNLKVEKKQNLGVVAGKALRSEYLANEKPKLYLILKCNYRVDTDRSDLVIGEVSSIYLESFITKPGFLKSDSRGWSTDFEILSGRIQAPSSARAKSCTIEGIPNPVAIFEFLDNLADKLRKSRGL